jgi:hypothetical protein
MQNKIEKVKLLFFFVLVFELRASHLVGRCCTTRVTLPAFKSKISDCIINEFAEKSLINQDITLINYYYHFV